MTDKCDRFIRVRELISAWYIMHEGSFLSHLIIMSATRSGLTRDLDEEERNFLQKFMEKNTLEFEK